MRLGRQSEVITTAAKRIGSLAAVMLAIAFAGPGTTSAQAYPDKPISLVVPFAPGGVVDTTGRLMAEAMAKHLGQCLLQN
jgi:tripartite-type tricarboxylate transporter receptor subunit TctC